MKVTFFIFSSTGWAYCISWLLCCLCVCLSVCLDVNVGGTNQLLHTVTCNLTCTDLLMNSDHKPQTRLISPILLVKIPINHPKMGVTRHFQASW